MGTCVYTNQYLILVPIVVNGQFSWGDLPALERQAIKRYLKYVHTYIYEYIHILLLLSRQLYVLHDFFYHKYS